MLGDCHIHMILDGLDFRRAIGQHKDRPIESLIRTILSDYRDAGITFLRDGGDAWGVSTLAARLAPEYGITYLQPGPPIHRIGRYGSFIGRGYQTMQEFRSLVAEVRRDGGDFLKIMISGLMDFNQFGKLSCETLPADEIREMIHIGHEEGFCVMAHANGDDAVCAALQAGVDSIEHGSYLQEETLHQLAESNCVWTPTLAPVGNLIGCGRFPDRVLKAILELQLANVSRAFSLGANIALGSDAGAYLVHHIQGATDEYAYLRQAIGDGLDAHLTASQALIFKKFSKK